MKPARLLLLTVLAALVVAFFAFDLGDYLSLDYFARQRAAIEAYRAAHPLLAAALFFLLYVAVTGASLPGAAILSLVAGAVFGLVAGILLVSFASTLGATLAFLSSRFLLRDAIRARYGTRLRGIDEGFRRDGAFYLFALRLVPAFPFFLVNLAMGLTPIRARTFYWVSQLGMLPATVVYVNAGRQLGRLDAATGLLTPGLVGALLLLAALPFAARAALNGVRARRAYRGFPPRPRRFDRNLIVIGAGAAGLISAYIAAAVRAKVTLIEQAQMGGDCLNTGCVPSKALLRAARYAHELGRGAEFGFSEVRGQVDFARVMERVQEVVRAVAPHDSVERYQGLGVECLQGSARLVDPWTVAVDGRRLSAPHIVIAAGAEPLVPAIPGLDAIDYLTSDTVWNLREQPRRLLVLGGGPIGCELAQAFARLGSTVTLVEMQPRLLPREDDEFSQLLQGRFTTEGIELRLGAQAKAVVAEGDGHALLVEQDGDQRRLPFDRLVVALGRRARLKGYGLETLGLRADKTLEVNEYLQTSLPHIYACGDVAGPYQFTHTASHQAWYAAVNSLFGPLLALRGGRFRADYSVIPWATFTDPEIARVGLSEQEAREQEIPYEVTRYELAELDRAIAERATEGRVKVLTVPGKDRILGVTIAGAEAGELIAEYVLAMRQGIGLNQLLGTIHIYPTLAEANKAAAGQWKRAHQPERLLRWVERYHAWRRG